MRTSNSKPKDGPFTAHSKDGSVSVTGQHRDGMKTGAWKYFLLNGRLKAAGRYVGDLMVGKWTWYRENGELMQTGSFTAGKKSGIWTRYRSNGALLDEGTFANRQEDRRVAKLRYRRQAQQDDSLQVGEL